MIRELALPVLFPPSTSAATVARPWRQRCWLVWAGPTGAVLLALLLVALLPGTPARMADWAIQRELLRAVYSEGTGRGWWQALTLLGDTAVALLLFSPLLLRQPLAYAAILATMPVGGLYSVLGKALCQVPRPTVAVDPDSLIVHVLPALNRMDSFPSGHSITAFAVVAALAAALRGHGSLLTLRPALVLGLALAAGVGLSRVAVGAHWPLDVLAGALGGWLSGLTGALWVRRRPGPWARGLASSWGRTGLAGLLLVGTFSLWRLRADSAQAQAVLILASAIGLGMSALVLRTLWGQREAV